MIWIEAKTWANIAPHEYVLRGQQPQLFEDYRERIEEEGKDEQFTIFGHTKTYRYFYGADYKYWIVGEVLNRTKV